MMKIKITREDGSLHSFDFYKKERCVFSISENGDMYYLVLRIMFCFCFFLLRIS